MRAPRHYLLFVYLNSFAKEKRETQIRVTNSLLLFRALSFHHQSLSKVLYKCGGLFRRVVSYFTIFCEKNAHSCLSSSSVSHVQKKFATLSEDTDERKEKKKNVPTDRFFQRRRRRRDYIYSSLSKRSLQKNHRPLLRVFVNCPSAVVVVVVVVSK